MMERKRLNKSWFLSKILDHAVVGTQEMLEIKRGSVLISEYFQKNKVEIFCTGSSAKGFILPGSDADFMYILQEVVVLYSETYPDVAKNILNKTVFFLRETDCQPGYVSLELAVQGENIIKGIKTACVPFQNSIFISSDIFRQTVVDHFTGFFGLPGRSNGPCATFSFSRPDSSTADLCYSFPCLNWPREALAWVSRTRLYGWPPDALINKIVQGGCHVVPLGDRCSEEMFLQWRVSFATAERQLVHSLSHLQMKVYVLMKYFLKQINDELKSLVKEDKILSSYIAKTIIFYAVENSPPSLWQDNHTFTCFQFCLSILIGWVKSAYCPHYFIPQNNLFLKKVCGQNRQNLLLLLLKLQGMKWNVLSVGRPTSFAAIGIIVEGSERGETSCLDFICPSPHYTELMTDLVLYYSTALSSTACLSRVYRNTYEVTNALLKPQTHKNEIVLYRLLLECLAKIAKNIYARTLISGGNKQTYKDLKKCKQLLAPYASLCTSPGKLLLATFHHLVGNYSQALHLCKFMTSPSREFISENCKIHNYQHYCNTFCGKGYSWYKKYDGFADTVLIQPHFCPDELFMEARRQPKNFPLSIPPLPYALFLTFLCHYHLGDIRKCKATLKYLERKSNESLDYSELGFTYNENHKTHKFWMPYSLLGICYQYVGDYSMAVTAFGKSLIAGTMHNSAKERIAIIYLVMCYQHWKSS